MDISKEITSINEFSLNNVTMAPSIITPLHFCQWILFEETGDTDDAVRIRYWDLMILAPNVLFLVFLLIKFKRTYYKLRTLNSPIIFTFYILVCVNVTASILRCLISMLVNAAHDVGGKVDQIFWVLVRFFLLSTEISVPVFALFFGHLENRHSIIRRVLFVTCSLSLAYSICQGSLELIAPDEKFYIEQRRFQLFSHGGMAFWFITCSLFAVVYFVIFLLPWTPCTNWFNIPEKSSFYVYTFTLSALNVIQAIGSGLFYSNNINGLCIIDATTYLYFTLFTPFVYWTFLAGFFMKSRSIIHFSYKSQIDESFDDVTTVEPPESTILGSSASTSTFPQQLSISSVRTLEFVYHQPELSGHLKQSASCSHLRPQSNSRQLYRSPLHSSNQNLFARRE